MFNKPRKPSDVVPLRPLVVRVAKLWSAWDMKLEVQNDECLLLCHNCNGNYTHILSAKAVKNGDVDIVFRFRCESCAAVSETSLTQHKGQTIVETVVVEGLDRFAVGARPPSLAVRLRGLHDQS